MIATYILYPIARHRPRYLPVREGTTLSQVAKLLANGRSQAVRLPAAYRFDTKEVFIRQDAETGDVGRLLLRAQGRRGTG